MSSFRNSLARAVLLAAAVLVAACSSGTAEQKILEQRARWSVQMQNWAEGPDGGINIGTRVSGPPNSPLKRLTVAVVLQDAEGRNVERVWHTFDLSEVQRGGPVDLVIQVPPSDARSGAIEGIGIDAVLDPGPEDRPHIPELND